jgi:hypothetical protein
MKNPCLDAALRELADAGIRDVVRSYGGKHIQLRWPTNNNGVRVFTLPATPSDHRAHLNVRTEIRRVLRNDGMIAERQPLKSSAPAPLTKTPDRITLLELRVRALELELEKLKTPKLKSRNLPVAGEPADQS